MRFSVTLATLPETTCNVALVLPAEIVTEGGSDDFALQQQTVYRRDLIAMLFQR